MTMVVRLADILCASGVCAAISQVRPARGRRNLARALIAEMREPTEVMLRGEGVHRSCHMCGGGYEQWQAMIDAALTRT